MKSKTTFGVPSLTRKTPMWAKWMFRITFIATTVAAFVIASDPAIADELKVRLSVYMKGMDMFIFGLSKLFGEKPYSYESDIK